MISSTRRSSRHHRIATRTISLLAGITLALAACGGSATIQDQAADAVNAYIDDDPVLTDATFDTDCVASTANGLTDDIAQNIVDDKGRIDFDVDERDRDDVYDFYNCADERDLARAIHDDIGGDITSDCLRDVFDDQGVSNYLNDADGNDPGRLGEFDGVEQTGCTTTIDETPDTTPTTDIPPTTLPPATTPPPTTTPPGTAPPTTAPPPTTPPTTTPPPTTIPPPPPPLPGPQPAPAGADPDAFAVTTETFLQDDPGVAASVGTDITTITCIRPSGVKVGRNYICLGSARGYDPANLDFIEFRLRIDAVDSFVVDEFVPALSFTRQLILVQIVTSLSSVDLQTNQLCIRDVVAGFSDADAEILSGHVFDDVFPPELSFTVDDLTNMVTSCVIL